MVQFFDPRNYIKPDQKMEKMIRKNQGMLPDEITAKRLADRGIGFDKKGKSYIEAYQFIKYALTRVIARENSSGIWFYHLYDQHYDLLPPEQYKKIFFQIIEEASETVWNASMEKQYMAYFKNKIQNFQTDGTQAGVLQFNNGILDFSGEEVEFLPPSPDYFCNFKLPYSYDEEADCPKFKAFLRDIFCGDPERIALIQEIMGACIYYEKCMQYLVVFLGNGSNGKSLLASVIKHMLGDHNVSAIALDRLSGDKFAKQNLDGKLLNISSETRTEKMYSTADFKALTGGDAIEIEKKFKNAYTTEIYCKFIVLANEMFQTDDNSDGFYRRLIIIPFDQQYHILKPGEAPEKGKKYQDIYLEGELIEELPGIFNFAMDGLLRLMEHDYCFTSSKSCENAKDRFKKEHNVVFSFLNDCFDMKGTDSGSRVKSSELFRYFIEYCKESRFIKQMNNITKKRFHNLLEHIIESEQLDIAKRKRKDGYYYVGISYKTKE